jgi:predicted  nucleic acid-binding Zn-ribbon protein
METRVSLQEKLYDLFLLDQQVRGLRTRLDAATRRLNAQSTKLRQLHQQHAELTDQHKHAAAEVSTLEHEANDAEERVGKLREQMNSVRNNKEYSAMLVEVNTLKDEKSKLEDQALEKMAVVDGLKERVEEVEAQVQRQTTLVESAEAEVLSAKDEVGVQLDDATAKRDAASAEVPADVLSVFNRLADHYDGETLGEIEEQDRRRREYTCGGCYMELPIERVNALMMKPDELVTCPSCNRFLFIKQELKAEIGAK